MQKEWHVQSISLNLIFGAGTKSGIDNKNIDAINNGAARREEHLEQQITENEERTPSCQEIWECIHYYRHFIEGRDKHGTPYFTFPARIQP